MLDGNPTDKVANIAFKNVEATAETVAFPNKYPDVKFKNVTLNGAPLKAASGVHDAPAVKPLKPD